MDEKTMRALLKDKPEKGYELKEIPIPDIESDEILFKGQAHHMFSPFLNLRIFFTKLSFSVFLRGRNFLLL